MDVQTPALRELFTARVTREWAIARVDAFMRRQMTGARELTTTPRTGVDGSAPSRVTRVDV